METGMASETFGSPIGHNSSQASSAQFAQNANSSIRDGSPDNPNTTNNQSIFMTTLPPNADMGPETSDIAALGA